MHLLGFFFPLTVLLRYNSDILQFTDLKCTFQGFLVHSQSCGTITIVNHRILSSPERNLIPIRSCSHFPSLSLPFSYCVAITRLLSVFIDFPILKISYKWDHTTYGLL